MTHWSKHCGKRIHQDICHRLWGDICSCGKMSTLWISLSLTTYPLRMGIASVQCKKCIFAWRLKGRVYMKILPDFGITCGANKVHQFRKALQRSPLDWFGRFKKSICLGYRQSQEDHTIFSKIHREKICYTSCLSWWCFCFQEWFDWKTTAQGEIINKIWDERP